jgi:hypothetical protein
MSRQVDIDALGTKLLEMLNCLGSRVKSGFSRKKRQACFLDVHRSCATGKRVNYTHITSHSVARSFGLSKVWGMPSVARKVWHFPKIVYRRPLEKNWVDRDPKIRGILHNENLRVVGAIFSESR